MSSLMNRRASPTKHVGDARRTQGSGQAGLGAVDEPNAQSRFGLYW